MTVYNSHNSTRKTTLRMLNVPTILFLLGVLLWNSSSSAEAFSAARSSSAVGATTTTRIIPSSISTSSCTGRLSFARSEQSTSHNHLLLKAAAAASSAEGDNENENNNSAASADAGLDLIFNAVDVDGSGALDFAEFEGHLIPAGYSREAIQTFFDETDQDKNGEISRDEFRRAILGTSSSSSSSSSSTSSSPITVSSINNIIANDNVEEDCPRGYFLNSVKQTCEPLSIIGRISQKVETLAPFQQTYQRISNLFGIDRKQISKLGISFALSYSIISNLNGAISFSIAWYMSCKRTGLSPLVPGQWKTLLTSYAMIYGLIQIFRPFRVAMAIGMSKLSAEYLEMTQTKLNCSRGVAIGCQYLMGQLMMAICASVGVSIVSLLTGVPLFG